MATAMTAQIPRHIPSPHINQNGDEASSVRKHHAATESTRTSDAPAERQQAVKRRNLGDWNLEKTIGAGSMGKVKLARHHITGEQVAVKIIPRIKLRDPNIKDPKDPQNKKRDHDESKEIRTIREAAISTLLCHPYICGMRDLMIMSHHYYMLFEYVDGGQMLDYIISHGKLKEKGARKFARQIASALDYCHYNSIAHRDLKIENILISKDGNIKIIDFGLSNLYSPRSHLSTFCGSLYFAAPELLNAKPYTGPEVDVWSFGIVLYVLVCGKVPFDDQNMPALHTKIKRGVVEYPNWLSTECRHLISRMLVVNPAQRATMAEVINHPWMVKSFDGPMDSYIQLRQPITLPLDQSVIAGMSGFDFGTSEEITKKLEDVLQSEDYKRAVIEYQNSRRLSLGPDQDTYRASSDQKTADPTKAYHPLLSIYHLVKEKQARDNKVEAPASDISEAQVVPNLEIPEIPVPESTHPSESSYEVQQPEPRTSTSSARIRARTHGEVEVRKAMENLSVSPHPAVENIRKTSLFRRLSSRKSRGDKPSSPAPSITPVPDIATPSQSLSGRHSRDDKRASEIPAARPISPQMQSEQSAMSRAHSVSEAKRVMTRKTSEDVKLATTKEESFAAQAHRAKSLGGTRADQLKARREAANQAAMAQMTDPLKSEVKQEEYIQKTGLKGLFSVSTTSSKSPAAIRADLLRTLDRLGVTHKEIKGGYSCLHKPSIDLTIMNELNLDREKSQSGMPRSPSKLARGLSLRRPSRNSKVEAAQRMDAADDSNDSMIDTSNDSSLAVRFEIHIVKVSWFNLHGVQFKRIAGNSWQYKSMASKILSNLKL